jgi:nicotinate phosphoribosyltransferase
MLHKHVGLYTDFYELTMAQAYFLSGKSATHACFDYFFREHPFNGGYTVFAGLTDLLELLERYRFEADDLEYLRRLGFQEDFLKYLETFRFTGTIYSVREGEIIFPLEPVVRVEGPIIEAQVIETMVLNLLNFESLIATKALRLRSAAGARRVVDFGLRRAQGLGGIQASKAAIIGGLDATSNVYAAHEYALEATGTLAHSWIQSFDSELAAFRKFAELFPERCVLLVDTYDTLRSGMPNAIIVAKELEQKGYRLMGVRLDSGDLAYLSKRARKMLDDHGLHYVKIIASNQLDEYVIRSLLEQGAPIDSFGVGTRLVTGQNSAALDGVYKLSMFDGTPRLKFSENFTKISLPGIKSTLRLFDNNGSFYGDVVILQGEENVNEMFHPYFPHQRSIIGHMRAEPLLIKVMEGGRILFESSPQESAAYVQQRLNRLAPEHKRFEFPHIYKVGISSALMELRTSLVSSIENAITKRN